MKPDELRVALARASERRQAKMDSMKERVVKTVVEGTFRDTHYECGCYDEETVSLTLNGEETNGSGGCYTLCREHNPRFP